MGNQLPILLLKDWEREYPYSGKHLPAVKGVPITAGWYKQHLRGDMQDFLAALALVFVLEGALYALFPDGMKRMMTQTLTLPSSTLRGAGLTAACVGVAALWFIRS